MLYCCLGVQLIFLHSRRSTVRSDVYESRAVDRKENIVGRFEYIVVDIDGDYAHLRRTDQESEELKLVARALLPPEIREGTRLLYEWMQYTVI